MAEYLALERVALNDGVRETGEKFTSDAVPGRAWKPIDKEAKAAVRARDEAARAPVDVVLVPGDGKQAERIAELEKELAEAQALAALRDEEIATLTQERDEARADVAAFDRDGDGKPGGSKPQKPPTE